ncbi:hypothetical protein LUZ60_000945 [Juncus effusus]|nr:hypothetical protein LUZ60_000945 [Juncus effusus]
MDPLKETAMKAQHDDEVMISIQEEIPQNMEPKRSSNEITIASSSPNPSPRKPPRPPKSDSLVRQRTIAKPKSRMSEQHVPSNAVPVTESNARASSPKSKVPTTPKTPMDGEDEDEEIYKKETPKKKRKWKVVHVIEMMLFVSALVLLIVSLGVPKLEKVVIWGLHIWNWCVMIIVIFCGRLVTRWLMNVLVFIIEKNFLLRNKVLYFTHGLKKSVQVFIWFLSILLSWFLVFNKGVERSEKTAKILNYVTRALSSLLIGSFLWVLKTFLMKMLASSFHMKAFFDRIQESIYHQYILQTLSGPPLMELAEKVGPVKSGRLSFRKTGKNKTKEEQVTIDLSKLQKLNQGKVSAWTMKGLINVISTSGLSTLTNEMESFEEDGTEKKEIDSEHEAKAAAYRIFKNVAKPWHKYIEERDLLRFLTREEVDIIMPLFEGAPETGKIKKSALRNWVVKAYLDRRALALSLNDTKTAVRQLHNLLSFVVIIISIIIALLLLEIASTKVLFVISSQLLVVVFIFGNSCKMVFEAIIFVFIMHPFDVGDRCVVDGVQMVVEEMNILTTVFLRYDNEKIYYPNSVLAVKPISNYYRSPNMTDKIEFAIAMSTSVESIGLLKTKIKEHLEAKPNHWNPTHSFIVQDIVDQNKLKIALVVKHTMNFQNIIEKNARRTELMIVLKKIFEELSITYNLLPQKVDVNYAGSEPFPVMINNRTD